MTEPEIEVFPVSIGTYLHHEDLPVDAEVEKVAEALAEFGGSVTRWDEPGLRAGDAVSERLSTWATSSAVHTVLYWVGHGASDGPSAVLAHARSPRMIGAEGITPTQLAHHVERREYQQDRDDTWAIVVIDACKSARFVERLNAAIDDKQGDRRLVLVGVSAAEASTTLGRFSAALRSVLHDAFRAVEEIELWDLARQLKRSLPGSQVVPKNVEDAVLRRRVAVPAGLAVPLDVLAEIEAVLAELTVDERRHFVPKAQGAELGEVSWYFEGREAESRRIAAWLRESDDGLLTVTGPPGSGKSALLGHLLVHSRPQLRTVLVRHRLADPLPEADRPPDGVFAASLQLTGLTGAEVVERLAAAFGAEGADPGVPLNARIEAVLAAAAERPGAILLDALDEAADALAIAGSVLRPLAAVPGVRLVVGTRRSTTERLDRAGPEDHDLLDALGAGREGAPIVEVTRDPAAISRYVRKRLITAREIGELDVTEGWIERFSEQVGLSRHEFLFARLVVHEVLATPDLMSWEPAVLLEGDHRQLFGRAVDRLTRGAAVNGGLLRALGYAQGRGLPVRDGIWAAVAEAVGAEPVADADTTRLLADAAPYLMMDSEHEQTVYRLAHRTFQEHYTGRDEADDRRFHLAITTRLAELVTTMVPNAYAIHHTSAHAGAAGEAAWRFIADRPELLDRLDPRAVAADAMRTAFGRMELPPEIAGAIGAQHLLAGAATEDRPGLRQLYMARHGGIERFATSPHEDQAGWVVRWAKLRQQPTHLTIRGHDELTALAVVPRPSGPLVAAGGADGTVRFWDPVTGAEGAPPVRGAGRVTALEVLPDGTLAVGRSGGEVRFADPANGTEAAPPLAGASPVTVLAVLPGTGKLVVGHEQGLVRVVDLATRTETGEPFAAVSGAVRALATFETAAIAIGGDDHAVRVREVGRASAEVVLGGHADGVHALVRAANLLVTADGNGTVRGWDPGTGREAQPRVALPQFDRGPLVVSGSRLAAGTRAGTIELLDLDLAVESRTELAGHRGPVTALASLPSRGSGMRLLVSGGADGTVRIWDSGEATAGTAAPESAVEVAAVRGPDGESWFATVSGERVLRFRDALTGESVHRPVVLNHGQVSTVVSAGSTVLLAGTRFGTVHWVDLTWRSRRPEIAMTDVGEITGLAVLHGLGLVAVCSDDSVSIWNLFTEQRRPMAHDPGQATAIAALPLTAGAPALLAIADGTGRVRIEDPVRGMVLTTLRRRGGEAVRALAVLPRPDDPYLVAGDPAGTIEIWAPKTGELVRRIPLGMAAHRLAATDEGCLVVSTADGRLALQLTERFP
ncbi:AAA family ATPase [Amycolatopsis lurida]